MIQRFGNLSGSKSDELLSIRNALYDDNEELPTLSVDYWCNGSFEDISIFILDIKQNS